MNRRKVKLSEDYLRSMTPKVSMTHASFPSLLSIRRLTSTKQQAFENMFAGIEKSMNDALPARPKQPLASLNQAEVIGAAS